MMRQEPSLGAAALRIFEKYQVASRERGRVSATLGVASRLLGVCGVSGLTKHRWDAGFDERYGVKTGGIVEPDALDIDAKLRPHAVRYEATPAFEVDHALSLLGVDLRDYAFIDYGCGLGRVVLVAARHSFRSTTGVEADGGLAEQARANVAAFPNADRRADAVEIAHADASTWRPPAAPVIAFMFNPFDTTILGPAMANLIEAASAADAPSYLIYRHPEHADFVAALPGVRPIASAFAGGIEIYRFGGAAT